MSTVVIIFLFLVVAQYVAYPANHYEQQLPMIVDYVNQHSSSLLIGEGKEEFERTFDLSKSRIKSLTLIRKVNQI